MRREDCAQTIENAVMAVLAAAPGLPSLNDIETERVDAAKAQSRGYYTPDEDERLRDSYHRFLAVRVSLWQVVKSMLPYIDDPDSGKGDTARQNDFLICYGIALTAASMLMRTGEVLVDLADGRPVVWKKLDEAEPRFGIERKTFTRLYQGLTAPKLGMKYRKSWAYYRGNKGLIHTTLDQAGYESISALLLTEAEFHKPNIVDRFWGRVGFRRFSFKRRHISAAKQTLFAIFEVSGSRIAELKQPFVKPLGAPKRVNADVQAKAMEICQPGDVFVTRHDDALSNVFLPGYWPHAALYIGTQEQRKALGLADIETARHHHGNRIVFMESKKDGVLYRPVEDTLELDAFVILRPQLSDESRRACLERAMSHVGKLYDFSFDFGAADRLACTELIYRSYHEAECATGRIQYTLDEVAGRMCLSAEALLNQSLSSVEPERESWFEVIAAFGIEDNDWRMGDEALEQLRASYKAQF